MASDHLRITIEFLSGGPLMQRGLLLYAPSTVSALKEELSYAHGVSASEITVYVDGSMLEDKTRVVDKRLYHVRLPPKWVDPLQMDMGLGRGVVAVEKGVTFEEGVHVDSMVEVDTAPMVADAPLYIAFSFSGVVRLFDTRSGTIISPTPLSRLGYCILYADWGRLRPLTKGVPTDPTTWLYDRLRRDYGILATSSVFGLHTAPLAELRRYHGAVEGWIERMADPPREAEGEEEEEGEEAEEEEGEEEEGEEEEEGGEDEWNQEEMDEPWQGTELDDSEWWR